MLTINQQSPDFERGINVGNDDFDAGAGEREVSECVRGDSMSTSLERIGCAHQNARMIIFGDCVQTMRRRSRQFRKQVLRIQRQPREQIAEVPIVLHFEQLVENPQL